MSVRTGDLLTGDERLAEGVLGYSIETSEGLYIPWIQAEVEGDGRVGRYLDALPTDRRIVFPTIISARLVGMLHRRGFVPSVEWSAEAGEWVDIMERAPR